MSARNLIIILIISISALIMLIIALSINEDKKIGIFSPTPSPTDSSDSSSPGIDSLGYSLTSAGENRAIVVAQLADFGETNEGFFISVKTSDRSPLKKIAISGNSRIDIRYYKNKTKEIFLDSDQSELVSIKNKSDLIRNLDSARGKNLIISFLLDSPVNKGLLSSDLLICNSENVKKESFMRADCTPFSRVLSAYDP